ncbi:Inner membrane protein YphA [Planctomycetales bacterium 10988]|nr:Inner membrane protein YphA [Planctomycetales bacterium 10988]
MSGPLAGLVSLIGRVLICLIFIMSTVGNKIPQFNETVGMMEANGVPAPSIMLGGAIIFLLVGGLSIVVGYKARIGALLLLIFLVLATYYFHDFWTMEGEAAHMQMIQFMKNLSMMGTMLFLMANGPGAWSLDNCYQSSSPETTSTDSEK